MNTFEMDFHLFATTSPQQRYTPLNPNYTGQHYSADPATDEGTYTQLQDLSAEMKTFYDKNLIRLAEPELVHDQFGQKRPIPGGNGKTIEFRKFNALPAVPSDRTLVEGITPNGQNYGVTAITATVVQYGGYVTISDLLNLTGYDPQMQEVMKLIASQAGQVADKVTRDILAAGTNVMYAGSATSRTSSEGGLVPLSDSDIITIEDIKKAVRLLKRVNAKTINGNYVAIVHPDIAYDLMNDSEWIDANHYAGSQKIFNGEIGKMYGVRFVESTMAKIWKPSSLPIYATLVLAENAYGTTLLEGGGIQTIVKQLGSGGTADPLNQRATVGWKLTKTACILEQSYMVRIESAATFGANAEAN